jgi:uncharacterized protein
MRLDAPLTESEFEEYEEFLLSDRTPESCMDISTLDGFLTALVSGPGNISPSHWTRYVWDQDDATEEPEFENKEEVQRVLGWFMRHLNGISQTMGADADDFQPMFYERSNGDETVRVIDEWCTGYVKAVDIDGPLWKPLIEAQPELLGPLLLYGTEEGWERLKTEPQTLAAHDARIGDMLASVRAIHAFWTARRREEFARPEPVRVTKTGRNEPCPCGSGKKYKRCHGS